MQLNLNGKGDKRRPQHIDDDIMQQNWMRTFGKKKEDNARKHEKDSDHLVGLEGPETLGSRPSQGNLES